MTNDADWVEAVKRWYLAALAASQAGETPESTDLMALGYEAAHPALQAQHWPDAPPAAFAPSRWTAPSGRRIGIAHGRRHAAVGRQPPPHR